jgi:hypothetical protein
MQSARRLTAPVPGGHPAWVPSWSLVWAAAGAMTRKNRQKHRQNDRQFAPLSPSLPAARRSQALLCRLWLRGRVARPAGTRLPQCRVAAGAHRTYPHAAVCAKRASPHRGIALGSVRTATPWPRPTTKWCIRQVPATPFCRGQLRIRQALRSGPANHVRQRSFDQAISLRPR